MSTNAVSRRIKACPVVLTIERALFRTYGQVIGLKAESEGRVA